jgi:hypothetical protein
MAIKIGDIERLGVFERRILRAFYDPIKERHEWRIRNNRELYDLYKEEDVITFIKLARLRWAGHVIRMEEARPAKRIFISNPGGARGRRPKIRWGDGVNDDIRNWRSVALNRETGISD